MGMRLMYYGGVGMEERLPQSGTITREHRKDYCQITHWVMHFIINILLRLFPSQAKEHCEQYSRITIKGNLDINQIQSNVFRIKENFSVKFNLDYML